MIPSYLKLDKIPAKRVHLGITGSIAAYKSLDLIRQFVNLEIPIGVTLSAAAAQFITPLSCEALGADPVYVENDFFARGQGLYGHLEPAQQAEILLIAPSTANTLAKLALGIADSLLTCQALAFDRQFILAPAMNPRLWSAQTTQEHIKKLQSRGAVVLNPRTGTVACGETGAGKMAHLIDIFFNTLKLLLPQDLEGKKILITLGPTREFWDAVRFWSNPSSGKMGAALAIVAWLRGADVTCVCGPNTLWFPEAIKIVDAPTAYEMNTHCQSLWTQIDIGCLCAAVCDFRPISFGNKKFKKKSASNGLTIKFQSNPDILAGLGKRKSHNQKLIGFAAETDDSYQSLALQKLKEKNLDLIVANKVNEVQTGFEKDTNQVIILDKTGKKHPLPLGSKANIAWQVWDLICTL